MAMNEESDKNRYVVVEWPECQYFMDDRASIHLALGHNAYMEFGDSAYFVSVEHYTHVAGHPPFVSDPVYLAVRFPNSQLFMDVHLNKIHLINDEIGLNKYGHAAYFVEERLYKKVISYFEKEVANLSTSGRFDFNR